MAVLALDDELLVLCTPLEPVAKELADCVLLPPCELALLRDLVNRSVGPLLPPVDRGKLSKARFSPSA